MVSVHGFVEAAQHAVGVRMNSSLQQCTSYNLSCEVTFLYTSWMAEMNSAIKFCFKAGLSVTETLALMQKAYGNEVLN